MIGELIYPDHFDFENTAEGKDVFLHPGKKLLFLSQPEHYSQLPQ